MDGDLPVEKVGTCVVITMNRGENRFNNRFISAMHRALDVAESYKDATCLVTIGLGKCYSLGLDLEWLPGLDPQEVIEFANNNQKLLARLLTFPLVTVAAINGHSYANGACFTYCHDYVVMRTGKGWLCLPEVKINRNFPIGYLKYLRSKVPHSAQHEAIVLGKRYTAEEALSSKVVQEICPMEQLKEKAIAAGLRLAGKDGLDRKVLSTIKKDLYHDAYKSLMEPINYYSSL